jgi:hypothetical protein
VIAAGAAALGLTAVPSGAGAPGANTVTIVKHVVGTAPAGTTFTVEVNCQSNLTPISAQAPIPTVTFDATGTATSPSQFNVPAGQVCTITETVTGAATTVGYACAIVRGNSDQIGPPFLGNCTGDNVVSFTDVIGDAATITVTNTFPTPAPPTPPAPPVAQAVQIAPAFTG